MQTYPDIVVGRDGLRGTLIDPQSLENENLSEVAIRLDGGREVRIPGELLQRRYETTYFLPLSLSDLESESTQERVIPVIEETIDVRKRLVETGVVRITKTVHEREETVDEPIYREVADVRRVAVNRPVDGPVAIREEGGVTIVPILEEVLVVEKRLILKEELHITKRREEIETERQTVSLRREEASVERVDTR